MKTIISLAIIMTLLVMNLNAQNLDVQGKAKITEMDTITTVQDLTAGNVVRLSDSTLALRQYKIGDVVQGGMVFWVDETGEHGLVSSLVDLESSIGDFLHQWSTEFEVTGATGDGIGAGAMNTMLAISAQRGDTDSAARLCADLVEGGYGDWYLPSKEELNEMYLKIGQGAAAPNTNIGGFSNSLSFYTSSTESSSISIWRQNFNGGLQVGDNKLSTRRVRAIRAF